LIACLLTPLPEPRIGDPPIHEISMGGSPIPEAVANPATPAPIGG
jgi:hypothetical protein